MNNYKIVTLQDLYEINPKQPKISEGKEVTQDWSGLVTSVPGYGKTTWLLKNFPRVHTEGALFGWGHDCQWNTKDLVKRIELEWAYGRSYLVIDDFLTNNSTQKFYGTSVNPHDIIVESIYTAKLNRQNRGEKTNLVITTNVDMIGIKDLLGERSLSRLVEICPPVLINGIDFRERTVTNRNKEKL